MGVTLMNPIDVIRSRLYNQPFDAHGKGTLYSSGVDAFGKILRTEGPQGFFKGWLAHFSRGAPHVALIFVFLEQLQRHRPLALILGGSASAGSPIVVTAQAYESL